MSAVAPSQMGSIIIIIIIIVVVVVFLGLLPRHMEVSRLGVQLEL